MTKFLLYLPFAVLILASTSTYAQDVEYKLNENYEVSSKGKLVLNTNDANVVITGSERKDASVNIYYEFDTKGVSFGEKDFSIDVEVNDGDLIIREIINTSGESTFIIGSIREYYEIKIELPSGMDLEIDGDDDSYKIEGMNGKITLDSDDGDVILSNCNGNYFNIDIDDGDFSLSGNPSGTFVADADDGDISVQKGSFKNISIRTDDGDVELSTSLQEDGKYDIRLDDGSLYFNVLEGGGTFKIYHDYKRVKYSDTFSITEKSDRKTFLDLPGGNAYVEIDTDDGKIELEN